MVSGLPRSLFGAAATAAMLALPAVSANAEPPCAERTVLLDRLQSAGRVVVARGATTDGDLYEVVADAAGRFSVVITFANGVSIRGDGGVYSFPPGAACVVRAGFGWQLIAVGEPV